jgi:Spy/CpxP family protein refolding chaperone
MKMSLHKVTRAPLWLSLSTALLFFCAARQAVAQGEGANAQQEQENATPQQPEVEEGVGLLRRLNLTPEQIGQIRQIRQQSEPEGRALVQRLNMARHALNEAIYQDQTDEALVRQRASELAEAQAAATRMRAQVEWRIRSVLSPAQLNTLRELRRQAAIKRMEQRRENRNRRQANPVNTYTPRPGQRPNATDNNNPPRRIPLPRLRRRGLLKP